MSESEDEDAKIGADGLTVDDKEQLEKLEANDRKVNKADKRKKRLENMGHKVEDADADS
jgi:hypothetical protein